MVDKMYAVEAKPIIPSTTFYTKNFKHFWCLLKLVQLICNTVITIIVAPQMRRMIESYLIASIGSLVLCSTIFLIKIHKIDSNINNIPWVKIELSFYITWSTYYLIVIAQATDMPTYAVAQVFSLICVTTFVIDACECYTKLKNEKCSCDSNFNKEKNKDLEYLENVIE